MTRPSRYKLLITDLDGTLLDPNGRVHERDRVALTELSQRGVAVSVCTGRMYSGTRDIVLDLGLAGPIGCIDGSQIVEAESGRQLQMRCIDADALSPLLGGLGESQLTAFAFADDTVFHDDEGWPLLPYVRTWSNRTHALAKVLDVEAFRERNVSAVVAVGDTQQIEAAAGVLRSSLAHALEIVTFVFRRVDGSSGMVIRATGASKGTALSWIAQHHGVAVSEVVAVGDWLNDIPMLRAAGRSFVMAQAPDEVKAAATDHLEADVFTGGGIAEAAERAGLL